MLVTLHIFNISNLNYLKDFVYVGLITFYSAYLSIESKVVGINNKYNSMFTTMERQCILIF